jgi:hypothetical protein
MRTLTSLIVWALSAAVGDQVPTFEVVTPDTLIVEFAPQYRAEFQMSGTRVTTVVLVVGSRRMYADLDRCQVIPSIDTYTVIATRLPKSAGIDAIALEFSGRSPVAPSKKLPRYRITFVDGIVQERVELQFGRPPSQLCSP